MYYVIEVFSGNEEKIINRILKELDREIIIDAFIPKRAQIIKNKTIYKALFPGYVFIETTSPINLNKELYKINELTKLLGLDKKNNYVAPLKDHEENLINLLLGRTDKIKSTKIHVSECIFSEGELVEVLSGPLKGFSGTISYINLHNNFVKIEFEFMGAIREAKLPIEIINKKIIDK